MTYYKHKSAETGSISVGRAMLGLVMIAMLVVGIMAREPLHDALFGASDVGIEGEWLGVITEDYGYEIRYEYRLLFTQTDEGIAGRMRVQSTNLNTPIIADSVVSGDVTGDTISFEETGLAYLYGISTDHWCRIGVTLDHEVVDGMETMSGTWQGVETPGVDGCIGTQGRIILTKQP